LRKSDKNNLWFAANDGCLELTSYFIHRYALTPTCGCLVSTILIARPVVLLA
jgi:hypothetical protein